MGTQQASAKWNGTLKEGSGQFNLPKANLNADYSFATRFENENGTNPEELVGAAISSCYSMFLAALLTNNGFSNKEINTTATVSLEKDDTGPVITSINLEVTADVENIENDKFQSFVDEAIQKCPISRLYATVEKNVSAKLLASAN